jgi:hypothetical protein
LAVLVQLLRLLWRHLSLLQVRAEPGRVWIMHKWGLTLVFDAAGNFAVEHAGVARYNARYLLHNCDPDFDPEDAEGEAAGVIDAFTPAGGGGAAAVAEGVESEQRSCDGCGVSGGVSVAAA